MRRFAPSGRIQMDWVASFRWNGRPNSVECAGLPDYESGLSLQSAHHLLNQYIGINPRILEYVSSFVRDQFEGRQVLGVHFRGTDKVSEAPKVSIDTCMQSVSKYLAAHPEISAIFLASDEAGFIDRFRNRCTNMPVIVHDDQARSHDGRAIHTRPVGEGPNPRGMEALVNSLLLSRCDGLIRTSSFLSAWSCVFNPSLPVVMLNRPYQDKLWFPDCEIVRHAELPESRA